MTGPAVLCKLLCPLMNFLGKIVIERGLKIVSLQPIILDSPVLRDVSIESVQVCCYKRWPLFVMHGPVNLCWLSKVRNSNGA